MRNFHAYVRATGMYVPERVVTNVELAEILNTTSEWIIPTCGVKERRYADVGITTSDLAVKAVQNLLYKQDVQKEEIDCIILATLSPDHLFPGTGVFLQEKLGLSHLHIPCYDIREQCSGYIYAMQMATSFIECGMYENVLIVGAEIHSHGLDFSERGRGVTVLFGDGAGASLISRSDNEQSRILFTKVHADGRGALQGVHGFVFDQSKKPIIDYDITNPETNRHFYPEMPKPKNLFVNAIKHMSDVVATSLNRLDLDINDVAWFLPHQANKRIIRTVAEKIGLNEEKVLYNIDRYGNTTAATIPLLLSEYSENGKIKRGDLLVMAAFGSGFTWGTIILRY